MSQLSSLPQELLLQIIETLLPADLENFCQCSQLLREIGDDALRRHKIMKAHYRKIYFGELSYWGHPSRDYEHLVQILRRILKTHRYALYPEELVFGDCGNVLLVGRDPSEVVRAFETTNEIENDVLALRCASYFSGKHTPKDWYESKVRGGGDNIPCVALALSLLPNLRSIVLRSEKADEPEVKKLVTAIVKAGLGNSSAQLRPLSNLTNASLHELEIWLDYDHHPFQMLALIPSMRRLYGKRLTGAFQEWSHIRACKVFKNSAEIPGSIKNRMSEVTDVTLDRCLIYVSSFQKFLSGFRALRKFSYEPPYYNASVAYWDPKRIVAALMKYTSYSLEQLSLGCSGRNPNTYRLSEDEFMGSLRGFEVLSHVRVDSMMFLHSRISKSCHKQAPNRDASEMVLDILPASIKVLMVVGELSTRHQGRLLEYLSSSRADYFPKLRKFEFSDPRFLEAGSRIRGVAISRTNLD